MAYRFNGSSDYVEFAIAPLSGAPVGPLTFAYLMKRSATSLTRTVARLTNASLTSRWEWNIHSSGVLRTTDEAGTPANGTKVLNSTSLWYMVAVTMPAGATAIPRNHIHDETSWTHEAGGGTLTRIASIAAGDRLRVAQSTALFAGDIVCVGIKKADSTDLQIEALSRTLFSAWTSFGFDWLIGFDTSLQSAGVLQDQASLGTGDQIAISGTSVVSDPPGWAWVPTVAPVADFTGTPLSGTVPLSVAFTDTSTNSPTSWAWTFGDGGTSTSQNPTHSYAVAGTYTVVLVATNATGSNTKTRTGYVTVSDQPRPIRINTSQGWADIGDATSFVSGTGAPTVAVGATGAIYLDTTSHRLYGPKAAGAWPSTPLGVLVPDYTGVTNGWSLKIVAGVPAWSA
jgi:hypothetical protein